VARMAGRFFWNSFGFLAFVCMLVRLLYPCDPFDKKKLDEAYLEEYEAARVAGVPCSLFSTEDFERGDFKARPAFPDGEKIVYRGWMLSPSSYSKLYSAIQSAGGHMLTTPEQYRLCHYLPEWYAKCEEFTPKTVFLSKDADFESELFELNWSSYFVKDYVKSLTTNRDPVAKNPEEVREIVSLIEKFRGTVEGGVCVRQFEELQPETEERYFVFNRKAEVGLIDLFAII
jgi:hypothetical protein